VTLAAPRGIAGPHLLVAASIDDARGAIVSASAVAVPETAAGAAIALELAIASGKRVVLLWDGEVIPGESLSPVEEGISDRVR
jgi:hypothetical protein